MRKATRNKGAAGNGYMLSNLPNDLLLNILDRLDTLDAIRTRILSKRMLKLPAMLMRIFLSVSSIPGLHDRVVITSELLRTNSAVAHVTDSILTTRSPDIAISKLRIRFILTQDDFLTITKSVAHAMAARKVDAAEFEITTEKAYKISSPDDLVRFGKQFNDFIGACPDAFAGLRCLWLRNMRFGELDIPNILSTCKLLESLHLTYCDSGIHSVLQVEHALLVELEVDYGQFERIELICLPKLQRVSYTGWYSHEDPLYFGFVPQPSKLSLTKTGVSSDKTLELTMFLANVPAITDLHLDFRSEKIWVLPECPKLLTTMLSKLQHVNLDNLPEGCDLGWTPFILEAAPSLKALCITVWDHWCIMATDKEFRKENGFCEKADVKWKPYAAAFKHKNLAKLTIYGLQPDGNFMRYIRCVVEAAVNMIEISLHDRKMCGRCGDLDPEIKDKVCPSRYPRTAEERKRAVEGLGLASPALIHFRS
ncbi:uncharacterized protein LOC119317892 [Triticum dicoccoides]|uniref:uncharacterized protein LOC119317892 n=1 Tax=Triticum dicoccoides TaxID=85692 RepID=UPI001891894C|nr:uncharacterized protein LOC119317892 [Triticum dicoccoides]XP_044406233.1 uncharacterized protein LOC123130395 [Triticum aestivum]